MNEEAKTQVCTEILRIMSIYHEQMNKNGYVDTPGGLENMGDVWDQLKDWEDQLKHAA